MVEIRHRTARKQPSSQTIPTSSSSSSSYPRKQRQSGFELQMPIGLLLFIIVICYFFIHHHSDSFGSHRHEEALSERVQFFRKAQKEAHHHDHYEPRSHDTRKIALNDDVMNADNTPDENVHWKSQQQEAQKLQKEKDEFQKRVKEEEEELHKEEEELKKEEEELKKERQALEQERTKLLRSSASKQDVEVSPLAYLHTLAEQHHHDPTHWSQVCADKLANVQDDLLESMLLDCAQESITKTLVDLNHQVSFEATERLGIANLLENYTCTDPTVPSSPDIAPEQIWQHSNPFGQKDKDITVHIKHNRLASQIHLLENFIDEEECRAMEEAARPKLHVATTADGKGGSKVSDARKAMQAAIRVPWHEEAKNDPIARLSRRVYDYTNHVLGLNITEDGQEDLMSIQYKGQGYDIPNPDRYTPHCDGDCTGLPHKMGTRMATMVMYCTIPDVGGATNFRNSNVHVLPQKGSAVFFSYIDPSSMLKDNHYTEHSGCPVYEGEKKIVTQQKC
eukprot:CAMPEP_0178904160 /NCGR_PEP_ID=MMETSP0786-20121207/5545_1 /TAXON_ID=186022 /ORGANISM="Thalassionema frauenfeldii, Strain CCMP 1798" /LENGTH=506 /DNA_ID=CAMNT_0020575585 /DNA_START=30 /DNA_END=1550 /DNA_ORIENTATION=+